MRRLVACAAGCSPLGPDALRPGAAAGTSSAQRPGDGLLNEGLLALIEWGVDANERGDPVSDYRAQIDRLLAGAML